MVEVKLEFKSDINKSKSDYWKNDGIHRIQIPSRPSSEPFKWAMLVNVFCSQSGSAYFVGNQTCLQQGGTVMGSTMTAANHDGHKQWPLQPQSWRPQT